MKQIAILCTLVAMTAMTYIPTILYESIGLSENFRYAPLVEITFLVAGVPSQLALYTVLLKWALAGTWGHPQQCRYAPADFAGSTVERAHTSAWFNARNDSEYSIGEAVFHRLGSGHPGRLYKRHC